MQSFKKKSGEEEERKKERKKKKDIPHFFLLNNKVNISIIKTTNPSRVSSSVINFSNSLESIAGNSFKDSCRSFSYSAQFFSTCSRRGSINKIDFFKFKTSTEKDQKLF